MNWVHQSNCSYVPSVLSLILVYPLFTTVLERTENWQCLLVAKTLTIFEKFQQEDLPSPGRFLYGHLLLSEKELLLVFVSKGTSYDQ